VLQTTWVKPNANATPTTSARSSGWPAARGNDPPIARREEAGQLLRRQARIVTAIEKMPKSMTVLPRGGLAGVPLVNALNANLALPGRIESLATAK
jgi:hypothetical protein